MLNLGFAPATPASNSAQINLLNIFGLLFCVLLTVKGLKYPSTADAGSSGSYVVDYYWGTELSAGTER